AVLQRSFCSLTFWGPQAGLQNWSSKKRQQGKGNAEQGQGGNCGVCHRYVYNISRVFVLSSPRRPSNLIVHCPNLCPLDQHRDDLHISCPHLAWRGLRNFMQIPISPA
ncbi:unnamed protein product, partial [Discosporangium mesarthrocarpum]